MSFGAATPSRDRTPLNVQTYRASSNESAKPVPYFCGKQRFALNFISDVFDEEAVPVTQTVGKQKSRTGYNYYASFAALACHGVVYGVYDILLNGDSVYAENTTIRIISLTQVGNLATATTKNAHGLTSGLQVLIIGVEQLEYLGTKTITVTDTTHFTFPITGNPKSPATTPGNGKITCRVKLDPILRDEEHPDYVDITIPDYGVVRLYWGTETQTPDEYLQTSGVAHPAYRGLCYAVFNRLFLGFNQTNVQNVEVILARYPTTAWLEARIINDDANLVSIVADLLQHPRAGMGLPDARIDTTLMLATADALDDEAIGFSPLITRDQELRQALNLALEYVDAFPVFDEDGALGLELVRPPAGGLPEIVDADLAAKPTFDLEDWSVTKNETRISFTNRLLDYKEDALGRPDTGARIITGEASSQTVDRMWVTDEVLAGRLQKAAQRSAALPNLSGRMRLRKTDTLFAALAPGNQFTIAYSGRDLSNLVFRVDKRTVSDPARPEFDIQFHADRSYLYG